jgi:hypothetical protein
VQRYYYFVIPLLVSEGERDQRGVNSLCASLSGHTESGFGMHEWPRKHR